MRPWARWVGCIWLTVLAARDAGVVTHLPQTWAAPSRAACRGVSKVRQGGAAARPEWMTNKCKENVRVILISRLKACNDFCCSPFIVLVSLMCFFCLCLLPLLLLSLSASFFSPVRFLLLTLEVTKRLLQLIREHFQILGQLVFRLELLGQQHQISRSIVQRHIRNVESLPESGREMTYISFNSSLFEFSFCDRKSHEMK